MKCFDRTSAERKKNSFHFNAHSHLNFSFRKHETYIFGILSKVDGKQNTRTKNIQTRRKILKVCEIRMKKTGAEVNRNKEKTHYENDLSIYFRVLCSLVNVYDGCCAKCVCVCVVYATRWSSLASCECLNVTKTKLHLCIAKTARVQFGCCYNLHGPFGLFWFTWYNEKKSGI